MRRTIFMLTLAAVVLGCSSLENRMVYYPRPYDPAFEPPPNANRETGREVTLTTAKGDVISARWYPNPQATGAILYCPGNAGNLQTRAPQVLNLWVALGQ